jgi:hypothetical protein
LPILNHSKYSQYHVSTLSLTSDSAKTKPETASQPPRQAQLQQQETAMASQLRSRTTASNSNHNKVDDRI